MSGSARLVVGRIIKPHGIRGEVVIDSWSDHPDRFAVGAVLYVDGQAMVVVSSRPHQGRLLVRFEGIGDRTAAEALRGAVVEGDPLPPADPDTYLVSELIDLPVRTADGREHGRVVAVIELPGAAGYDLLEVRREQGGSWLLPAADELVEVVEEPGGWYLLVRDPPEGLLD